MNGLTTTFFLIAALCLLPAWFVGLAAFGAAVGLLVYNGLSKNRLRRTAEDDHEEKLRRFAAEWAEAERAAELKRHHQAIERPADHLKKPNNLKIVYLKDRR